MDGIAGFRYNETTYLYRKNLQGDITHIYTEAGKQVAHYAYDAWGNYKILQDIDGIGSLNAFRYRGYYFDEETGLYYLQTRYYDPELGRFISADSIEYLDPETIGGLNLYAYCGNNPILNVDKTGTKGTSKEWLDLLGLAIFAVIFIVAANTLTFGAATPLICGTLAALGVGFLAGAGGSLVGQLIDNGGNFSALDPTKAINDGIEVAVISGVCAAFSIGFAQVGLVIGQQLGAELALYSVGGVTFGQVFGGFEAITTVCGWIGSFLGTLSGGIFGGWIGNEIFGKESNYGELLQNSFSSILEGWINKIFKLLDGDRWENIWKKLRPR